MFTVHAGRAGARRRSRLTLVTAALLLVALAALFPDRASGETPQPAIGAELGGSIMLNAFSAGTAATVRVYDAPGGTLLYQTSVATGGEWYELERDVHGLDLAPGMAVTGTDGTARRSPTGRRGTS